MLPLQDPTESSCQELTRPHPWLRSCISSCLSLGEGELAFFIREAQGQSSMFLWMASHAREHMGSTNWIGGGGGGKGAEDMKSRGKCDQAGAGGEQRI